MYIIINDEEERWEIIDYKDIKPNYYKISNYGNIVNIKTGRKLNPYTDSDGYHRLELAIENKRRGKKFYVHRLVAIHFIEDLSDTHIVNHKDSIRNHNYYKNLEWVTPLENSKHGKEHGFIRPYYGVTNKYDKREIHKICKLIEDGYSTKEIINILGYELTGDRRLMKSLIVDIRNRNSHKDVSKKYNF